jgi:hypothetical protein
MLGWDKKEVVESFDNFGDGDSFMSFVKGLSAIAKEGASKGGATCNPARRAISLLAGMVQANRVGICALLTAIRQEFVK